MFVSRFAGASAASSVYGFFGTRSALDLAGAGLFDEDADKTALRRRTVLKIPRACRDFGNAQAGEGGVYGNQPAANRGTAWIVTRG
jgi:hypothetical protein